MPMTGLLGGLDVGTTSAKAVLMSPDGVTVAVGRAPTRWVDTPDGVEADPFAISAAAHQALAEALASTPGATVSSLGIASMAEAGVLVDGSDAPVAPVIAWHDTRDVEQLSALERDVGGERFSVTTGLPLWTQWSLTKHRWLHENSAPTRAAVRRYNIAEWVARSFGAAPVCELSLASRTGWLDLRAKAPWLESLEWARARATLLGDLVEAGTPIGTVGSDCLLPAVRGATITIAGHDHQAAAIGAGAFGDQDELDSCGTADAIVRTTLPTLSTASVAALTAAGITVGWHALRGRWCVLGATQGGLVLQGILGRLGLGPESVAELDRWAELADPAATRVVLGPAAHDAAISGSLVPGDLWRAATESVTSQLRELTDVIADATGPRGDLVVTGGWANSTALMAAKTAAFGTLWKVETPEAGARGAALLGGLADGTFATPADLPRPERVAVAARARRS